MAMALGLFGAIGDGEFELKRLSIPYFRRGVEATRAAWGAQHPEYALALNDYAVALDAAYPHASEAISLLEQVYEIRLAALGADHIETKMARVNLAEARAQRARTDGELGAAAAAAPPSNAPVPPPGEGSLCLLAIYSAMSQIARACHPGESPEMQSELESAVGRLSEYVVANGGGSSAEVERFKREYGGVGLSQKALCQGDGSEMYDAMLRTGPRQVRASVDEMVARPGTPSLGDCL